MGSSLMIAPRQKFENPRIRGVYNQKIAVDYRRHGSEGDPEFSERHEARPLPRLSTAAEFGQRQTVGHKRAVKWGEVSNLNSLIRNEN